MSRPKSDVTDSTVIFTGFDPSIISPPQPNGFSYKLDLLFYNRVNEVGEVLSSLVYISTPTVVSNIADKIYNVKSLYSNTDAERTMHVTLARSDYSYLNTKWKSDKFFTSSISSLSDCQHNELPTNGELSVRIKQYGVAFDGWYTQMSVGVRDISPLLPPTSPVKRGLIGFHTFSELGNVLSIVTVDNPTDPFSDQVWSPYTTLLDTVSTAPDGSVLIPCASLADVLTTLSADNPYIKQDIFILPTYASIYNNSVIQYAEFPTYGNLFTTLRDKHRVIHSFAVENNFLEAQYVLQSTDFQRMTAAL
jgi:hypothetical protein